MAQNFSPRSDTRITVPGAGTNVNGKEVYYGGNKATVMMGRQYLSIERERAVLVNVALRDIISVLVGDANSGGGRSSVTICYIRMSGASMCIPQVCDSECSMPEAVQLHFDCLEAEALVSDVRKAARLPPTRSNNPARRRRSFAAILNPASGNSRSLQVLQDVVIPILSLAGVELTTFFTKAKGDAEKFSRTLKLDTHGNEFEGLISLGGDGTATEVHSGNMRNLRLPFTVIPVGSDNSLATTLGILTVVESLLAIIKGPVIAVDVLSLHELPAGSTTIEGPAVIFPMCCVALGVMADALVDIERTRWMGKIRTTLVTLKRIVYDGLLMAGPRKYKWTVKYRPRPITAFSKCTIPDQLPCKVCEGPDVMFETVPWQTISFEDLAHVTIGTHAAKIAHAPKLSLFPPAHHGDGAVELFTIKGNRLWGMIPHVLGTLSGTVYYDDPSVSYCKASEVLLHCDSDPDKGPGSDHWVMGVDGEVFRPRTPAVGIKIHPRAARMYIYREYWGTSSSKNCLDTFFSSAPKREIRDL